MLTIEDMIDMSDFTQEEVDAIAEHEHCSRVIATGLGESLVQQPVGRKRICRMIREDLEAARAAGDRERILQYELALQSFCGRHPDADGETLQ